MAYKNFWSLNVDEAVTIGMLRGYLSKNLEVFMPANAQMKDIDFIIVNMKNKKMITVQVKGSRAYEPKESEVRKFGDGSAGWFHLNKNKIDKSNADFFIFLIYVLEENKKIGRISIRNHMIVIPTNKLKMLCKKYKKVVKGKIYNFFIWINPIKKRAIEFRDRKYYMTRYLDEKGLKNLYNRLK